MEAIIVQQIALYVASVDGLVDIRVDPGQLGYIILFQSPGRHVCQLRFDRQPGEGQFVELRSGQLGTQTRRLP